MGNFMTANEICWKSSIVVLVQGENKFSKGLHFSSNMILKKDKSK